MLSGKDTRLDRKTKRKNRDEEDEEDIESTYCPTTSSSSSSSSSSSDCSTDSEPSSSHSQQLIIVNGTLIDPQAQKQTTQNAKKKYICHWKGCLKSYTKPIRLEEHIRSHTNERPFGCPSCPAAYRRETHLTAHMRMHLPGSSRPLLCGFQDQKKRAPGTSQIDTQEEEGCQRRFWTHQHLKIHRENVHEGKKGQTKLKCDHCNQEFIKHRALRSHILEIHSPQDSKPYICPHPNCTYSFPTPSKLRKHERTHDPFRYTCVHQDCLDNVQISVQDRSFSSWTDLQRHTRDVHPFKCIHLDCPRKGKPFKSLRSLTHHLQRYHPDHSSHPDPVPSTSSTRNTGSFVCTDHPPCNRSYQSARALQRHVNLIHLIHRHTSCTFPNCGFSSAFPSGLIKHIKSKHPSSTTIEDEQIEPPKRVKLTRTQKLTQVDLLTGIGYSNPIPPSSDAITHSTSYRKFACPFSQLNLSHSSSVDHQETDLHQPPREESRAGIVPQEDQICLFRFNRLYDVQRHLKSHHSLSVERDTLKDFFGVV
ncbi:hypothetical protein MJO28_017526 [Puccinia striiformis f. sp. tritici]|nr:hypothetical protein MJO28_017526 [Puccinia striiformis f. sp. tritici]